MIAYSWQLEEGPLHKEARCGTRWEFAIGQFPQTALSAAIALLLPFAAYSGDILRGGAGAGSRAGSAIPASPNAAVVEQARANASDTLARTNQTVQAMQALQATARGLALRSSGTQGTRPSASGGGNLPSVPDGLATGGLKIATGVTANSALWQGAALPVQSTKNGSVEVSVTQTQQQAVLHWDTFNIGKQTTLSFDQDKGGKAVRDWVAINEINDPSGVPSQILGRIEAKGQVYVLNQNGILFGGSAQVNTHALVASSLPINDNLLARGLLNNPDAQFLFSALYIPALKTGGTMPSFTPPPAPNTPGGRLGDVIVEPGAQLSAPSSADGVGGRITLIGPNVRNGGSISTPDGQTILAAGLQVGFTAHDTGDPSLRGLDVFVGEVRAPALPGPAPTEQNPHPASPVAPPLYAGSAINTGIINAPRADVTIAGKTVDQLGVVQSSTSVTLSGRIDFLASYDTTSPVVVGTARFSPGATGSVTLGAGSITTILPEYSSSGMIAGATLPIGSQLNLEGRVIHIGSDALLFAPSATATLRAGAWLPLNGASTFVSSSGQIYFDSGGTIDVAGTPEASAPIAQNILTLQLRGSELADSPLQRDGVLRATTISVDIRKSGVFNGFAWVGTPLGDVSGFVNLVQRDVSQLTTVGGSVTMSAGSSVIMQPGSVVDVSGGWTNFQAGFIETTRVLSGGRLYDIANATPDLLYTGIYHGQAVTTSARWGITDVFAQPLALTGRHWEDGYTQGAAGGSLTITAPAMALDGELRGATVTGPRQRDATSAPAPSALSISFQAQDATSPAYLAYSPTPPNILVQTGSAAAADSFAMDEDGNPLPLQADRRASVKLSPTLLSATGFGSLTVQNVDGNILLPAGVSLTAAARGSVSLTAANLSIAGDIVAPGGTIALTALNISPGVFLRLQAQTATVPKTPSANPGRGRVSLANGATLSTAGLVVDERPGSAAGVNLPLALDGGSIAIAGYSIDLATGTLLDASGGVRFVGDGTRTFGSGGSIGIKAGQDPELTSVLGGTLRLGAELRGFSGGLNAGALALQAPLIQIGGAAAQGDTLLLPPEFFSRGGFGSFSLTGLGAATGEPDRFVPGILVAPGVSLAPVAQRWLAQPHGGTDGGVQLVAFTAPEGSRAPVSLSLNAPGVFDTFSNALTVRGDVILGEGASVVTDPRATVALAGNTVTVLGAIFAPGGTISVSAGKDSTKLFSDQSSALSTVYLGPDAVLSARGATLLTPDAFNRRTGTVLPGGSITVVGNILARAGALLDVSGATDVLDFPPGSVTASAAQITLPGSTVTPANSGLTSTLFDTISVAQRVDSSGGSITLAGAQSLQSDATLLGAAGGPTAAGGRLSIGSGRFYPPGGGITPTPLDVTLDVTAHGNVATPFTGIGATLPGIGQFTSDRFSAGGFDSLGLKGTVQFAGPVSITARGELSVADGGVLYADSAVQLAAPYVKLGTAFTLPVLPTQETPPFEVNNVAFPFSPSSGTGSLTVQARLLDLGNLSLQNIARADFRVDGGDLRGVGTLDIAGDLTIHAAQIYPATALPFTIAASEKNIAVLESTPGGKQVTLASAILPPGFGIGSPLLGSTVAAIDGDKVTLASGADVGLSEKTLEVYAPGSGSVRIVGSGTRQLPLSAGGQLNIFGASIEQGGTLVAPFGRIVVGWDGIGTAPQGAITGTDVAVTQRLTLSPGSITSVSAISPLDGTALTIPYGLNLNGVSWIDPRGLDITGGGAPQKAITVAGVKVDSQARSFIDVRGGGDLYAYRWVKGLGGSRDILASDSSFAVLPGYTADFAPYAPFGTSASATTTLSEPGYVNGVLKVGDKIFLAASPGLPAGSYTLLPARYALLPGASLVTPAAGAPGLAFSLSDGSSLVSGYRFNDLNPTAAGSLLFTRFEVAPAATFRQRAEYRDYFANDFLADGARRLDTPVPRLPGDAGHLILEATQSLAVAGRVAAQASDNFRAGLVDLATDGKIVINGGSGTADGLDIGAAQLNSFGAESLLIGGIRTLSASGAMVTVRAGEVTVNAGTPLQGSEIILVAKDALAVAPGAQIAQTGRFHGNGSADLLLIGDAAVPDSGDGVLLRVSSDLGARMVRAGIGQNFTPALTIGAGARLSGASLTIDSTAGTSLDPLAILHGRFISLDSGQISIELNNPGQLQPSSGLVLGGAVLGGLRSSQALSLLSYSSLDFYGTGTFNVAGSLALHAGEIRGFNDGGGTVHITTGDLLLDNASHAASPGVEAQSSGSLVFDAATVRLGEGQLRINQFDAVTLNAPAGLLAQGSGGVSVQGQFTVTTPFITASKAATQSIVADGALDILAPLHGGRLPRTSGLGASLTLGGESVLDDAEVLLPSGQLTVHATTGDLTINGKLQAGGTAQVFNDLTRYTDAGEIVLRSDQGSVSLGARSIVDVAAAGGAAGRVEISAPLGTFTLAGSLRGQSAQARAGASFALDIGSLPSLDALSPVLASGGFTGAQSFRIRSGDVVIDGVNAARTFDLSADLGGITVTGLIDASGTRGGNIALAAGGSITLSGAARLTVAGQQFDAAGKGGTVSLETRGLNGGQLDLQPGSAIDLSVASFTPASASLGQFSGTLHLRAPQTAAGADLSLKEVGSTITGASNIIVEGFHIFDLTGSGLITSAVQGDILANGTTFGQGVTASRLLAANPTLGAVLVVVPGAEIINATGNLTLGAANSSAADDWNLAAFRFGSKNAAGALTLRAAGDLVFYNALSDGFTNSAYNSILLPFNPLLPANAQSYSYTLTAAADLSAADASRVLPLVGLAPATGSLLLGKNAGTAGATAPGLGAQTAAVIGNRYQVIRTGSGDIQIAAGRDVQLLNHFASIYTAGTQVGDPTLGGVFDVPKLIPDPAAGTQVLGAVQQTPAYPVQFTLAGGNVSIAVQGDLAHYTRSLQGLLIADSSRELPVNWLERRGFVNQGPGEFGAPGGPGRGAEAASTAWWVDFSNFFEGVGALGGGNITLTAGQNIANVDAVIPTNARMPKGTPNANGMVELGGGDLIVHAGADLDAGVYYVESGHGTLDAGGSITTNFTRSPSLAGLNGSAPLPTENWLPTTLFAGRSGFDVSARGDVLLGPAANPFLLPQGYNNTVWYKTYFSTYAPESFINVSSLAGSVTLRESASVGNAAEPLLQSWLQDVLAVKPSSASFYQPWLRLDETSVAPFSTVVALAPATLRATAFSGDIDLVGGLTLTPSPIGTVELAANGSINGVQRNGAVLLGGATLATWGSASINLSDANPALIPVVVSPFAYQSLVGTVPGLALTTAANFLSPVNSFFAESGALRGPDVTLSSKQALHAPGLLHAGDPEPVRLFAKAGSISGLTLFSGKAAHVIAGGDIADVAFYVQDVDANDVTLVAAGRDLVLYNANSPLLVAARSPGNVLNVGDVPLAGDVQLAGPGALEVLAGRNLDLGIGPTNTDGTGVGVITVGNARNPSLPSNGASILVGAGIGPATGLAGSSLDFNKFTDTVLKEDVLAHYLPGLDLPEPIGPSQFKNLPAESRDRLALTIFYRVLRDAGRAASQPGAVGPGAYDPGFAAISALFSQSKDHGEISLTSRTIETQSGGSISVFAPGGKLSVGLDVAAGQAIDQGILTEAGGDISIFTKGNVDVGSSRIFTLRGGNILIWSSEGDIAAGAAAKTVQAAPPTRVILDPQSADVATDLAGLATGGGIGVLATVAGVPPGDVDLIAQKGKVDAGDAGIRSTGNLNVAAVQVLNADNIQVSGTTSGAPTAPTISSPNLGALTSAQSTAGSASQAANDLARQAPAQSVAQDEAPSVVTVEVLGYGGGD